MWLYTTSRALGEQVIAIMPRVIAALPEPARSSAAAAWRDYGEVVFAPTREEICEISDRYAPEHLQVLASDLDWWLERLTNYGSLFLGEETTVAYGDKCSRPEPHPADPGRCTLLGWPERGPSSSNVTTSLAACSSREVGQVAARISRLEGMEGHARTGDIRLKKYFPQEQFELGTLQGHQH